MKAHELARELLDGDNLEIMGSICLNADAGPNEEPRHIFTNYCNGSNGQYTDGANGCHIILMFDAEPIDNLRAKI